MRKNKKKLNNFDQKQSFADGFSNLTAKLGISGADNQLSQGYYAFNYLTQNRAQLDAAYRSNWLASALVDCVADDMTRAGFSILGDIAPEKITEFTSKIAQKGLFEDVADGIRWGRLYGGALALILLDGADYTQPLDFKKIKKNSFRGLQIFDRARAIPNVNDLIQGGRDVGLPRTYDIVDLNLQKVHHSHILRFIGDKLPYYQAAREQFWGASVFENVFDRMVAFETVTLGAANLAGRAHLRTISVEDLRQILAAGGKAEENLIKQFSYVRQMQNSEGITLLDSKDKFETSSYSFTGLDALMLQFVQQISGAKRIPLPILFGQSPAGLNATADSDIRIYYDRIAAMQNARLEDDIRLLKIFYISCFGEQVCKNFKIKYNSLWQMSDTEKTIMSKNITDNIIATFNADLIDKATALKELKQASEFTNIYTNISNEAIIAAEEESAPPSFAELESNNKKTNILTKVKTLLTEDENL